MIPGSANALLLGSAAGGYTISRSARFNAADSAYLSRTPASAGNRKTWTWAGWVKRSNATGSQVLFSGAPDQNYTLIWFAGDTLSFHNFGIWSVDSLAVFRDYSAWLHVVAVADTTNAVADDRLRLYVNGARLSLNVSGGPAQNTDLYVNQSGKEHRVGSFGFSGIGHFFNGYLADIHFIDGQALDPTSFGEFSATTGVWMPKRYAGTYGTNGFKLDFSDNSAATATTLGKDSSGNGNNWTPNNLSVTTGAGNDSLVDVPTNGSEVDTGAGGQVRGNYATLNALKSSATLSNGNLQADAAASNWYPVVGTIHVSSGKWYWEVTPTALGLSQIGVATPTASIAVDAANIDYANCYTYYSYSGNKFGPTSNNSAYGAAYSANDVIGVALDMDAGTLVFYKNNASQGTAYSGLTGLNLASFVAIHDYGSTGTAVFNFGQRPFAYTAPSGFKALCTANLPTPTIVKPSTVMDVVLYTGTGSALTPTSTLGFNPDLVWVKGRSGATDHALYDAVRGVEKRLESNTTDAEVTSDGGVTAFNSAGFSVGTLAQVNTSSATYAAWLWDAGSSTVTNTQGSITSSVRANPSAGFSIVTGTQPSSGSFSIGHGLGVAPSFFIYKVSGAVTNWGVWHTSLSSGTHYVLLNSTAAQVNDSTVFSASPTSSIVNIGSGWTSAGAVGFVAYCFAPVAGYSAFGSYTGNGQTGTSGPFIYCGFRPRFILIKKSSSGDDWKIFDSARDPYNRAVTTLVPNNSSADNTGDIYNRIDILSNGFAIRVDSTTYGLNTNDTFVWAAFAESPFSLARAR
jgi:hypothetical protein